MKTVSDFLDVIVEPRYDTNTILAAGTTLLTYFAQPLGQGTSAFGGAATAKTLADTNMELAGQLPAGYNFIILGFRVQPSFRLTQADAVQWSAGCWFTFTIGSKPYLRVPVDTLPAGAGPFGFYTQTAAATAAVASHGYPTLSNSYQIGKKPLELQQTQNFQATLQWVSVVAVTTTQTTQPAAGMPVRVFLDGFLKRIVQ